jgi:hypothetical protein
MLTEARVLLPGVQALLGFQLIAVLTKPFEQLPIAFKIIHAGGLVMLAVAIVSLLAPAALHRRAIAGTIGRAGSRRMGACGRPRRGQSKGGNFQTGR